MTLVVSTWSPLVHWSQSVDLAASGGGFRHCRGSRSNTSSPSASRIQALHSPSRRWSLCNRPAALCQNTGASGSEPLGNPPHSIRFCAVELCTGATATAEPGRLSLLGWVVVSVAVGLSSNTSLKADPLLLFSGVFNHTLPQRFLFTFAQSLCRQHNTVVCTHTVPQRFHSLLHKVRSLFRVDRYVTWQSARSKLNSKILQSRKWITPFYWQTELPHSNHCSKNISVQSINTAV